MVSRADAPDAAPPVPVGRGRRGVPGIHDVARLAGVSTATVSRALRGVDRVSAPTRTRVLQAAADLGYVASPSAASLASGRTGVVGVIAPFLSRWFFAHALDGVEGRLREDGLHVLLFNVGTTRSSRSVLLDQQLLRRRVDAVVVLSCDLEPEEVAVLQDLHVPVVTLGVDVTPWHRVGIDDVAAGRTAMQHLLSLGHRDIAYVGGDRVHDVHVATAVDRRAGILQAAEAAGVPAPRELVGDWTLAGGAAAGELLLDAVPRPTAVIAASDEMAVGVLGVARRRGLRVPEDLSVVGVDDHEFAGTHDLTTVAQPVDALGRAAADLLVDVLQQGVAVPRRTVVLPTRLVVRGSTGSLSRTPASPVRAS
ncbi:MAG: transcriptional regulator, LacI family [Frankiales bacterium]|nr:transcriptional regulator, LacI family [Frankiales bacterium]